MIPAVGGGFNLAETKLIANRAYKSFFEADITAFGDCKEESQSPRDDGILQGMQDDMTDEFFEYEFHGEEWLLRDCKRISTGLKFFAIIL